MKSGDASNEGGRRAAHAFFGLPAFLVPWMDWRLALLIGLYFLFLNVEVLPRTRIAAGWRRPGESRVGGMIAYPLAVVLLIAVFQDRSLPIAAGWCAMSFGDPVAAWSGRRFGGRRCPWNPGKTVIGMLGFFVAASVTIGLVALSTGRPPVVFALAPAAVGAVVESLPVAVDDNLLVAMGAGATAAFVGVG